MLEFDQAGTLVHSWGGPGSGYDWPQTEHGVFVDHKDVVWLAGSGATDAQLLKFTLADGYVNRRVIVLHGDTFAFKRMWGAYGNRPDDTDPGPYNPDAARPQQFRLPHNVAISRDSGSST